MTYDESVGRARIAYDMASQWEREAYQLAYAAANTPLEARYVAIYEQAIIATDDAERVLSSVMSEYFEYSL